MQSSWELNVFCLGSEINDEEREGLQEEFVTLLKVLEKQSDYFN